MTAGYPKCTTCERHHDRKAPCVAPAWIRPPSFSTRDLIQLLAAIARLNRWAIIETEDNPWWIPKPGDLVIEVSNLRSDVNSIGVLIGHDVAAYHPGDPADGSVPMREVWDIFPLTGDGNPELLHCGHKVQRWEDATFVPLPPKIQELARELGIIARKPADG